MDVTYMGLFAESFTQVMSQFGFADVRAEHVDTQQGEVLGSGIVAVLGLVGSLKGNVVYTFAPESAKKIAGAMMGMSVEAIDDMAKSALSELTNMLTANAATLFSNRGILVDISTPTLLQGENISIKMEKSPIDQALFLADGIPVEVSLSINA